MHPSPAERFYMEQQRRAEEDAWAAQAAHTALLAHLGEVQATRRSHLVRAGGAMKFERKSFEIGEIDIPRGDTKVMYFEVPWDTSTALSLFATVSGKWDITKSGGNYLWWSSRSGFDGQSAMTIQTDRNDYWRVIKASGNTSARYHGPFGPYIEVAFFLKDDAYAESARTAGRWIDVKLDLGTYTI